MNNIIDKSKELKTSINLLNEKLHFSGNVDGNQPVSIDYTFPLGDNLGYTSLELLLLSLSSCVASAVLVILRKKQKNILNFSVNSTGIRKQEHPTGFSKIVLEFQFSSDNTTIDEFENVLKLAEPICPVWSMLKGNVEIESLVRII